MNTPRHFRFSGLFLQDHPGTPVFEMDQRALVFTGMPELRSSAKGSGTSRFRVPLIEGIPTDAELEAAALSLILAATLHAQFVKTKAQAMKALGGEIGDILDPACFPIIGPETRIAVAPPELLGRILIGENCWGLALFDPQQNVVLIRS